MHIHGENEVEAILAPNRYRKLYQNVGQVSEIQHLAVELQKQDFPDKADRALGLGLCTCWEPTLQWEKI